MKEVSHAWRSRIIFWWKRIIVICPIKSHNPALSLWNKQSDTVNNVKCKMPQDRLRESKLHGIGLMKKVHEKFGRKASSSGPG